MDKTLTQQEKATANRAILLVDRGSDQELEEFEDLQGGALSTVIDELWDLAVEQGDDAMSKRLGDAFSRLVTT